MRLLVLASVFAALGTGLARAADDPPIPICAQAGVLEHVASALRRAGRPFGLEPATVGQISTAPGGFVRCAVRTHRLAFDTNRFGYLPLDQPAIVEYTLELRRNGVFLHID